MNAKPHLAAAALLAASLLSSATLPGQRMPMPDGRILQMFDLREIQVESGNKLAPVPAGAGTHAAAMLRHFVDPPLRDGDDITAVGRRWVAVLADEQRIASVDRLLQAAKKHRNDLLTIEVKLLDISAVKFKKQVLPKLVAVESDSGTSYQSVFDKAEAKKFVTTCAAAADTVLAAPRLSVLPLQQAHIQIVKETAYVKEFTVHRDQSAVIADPVVATVWDGHKSEVCATFLPNGAIGLRCAVTVQEVEKPIREVETEVIKGGQPVTIQLPHVTGVKLANVAELATGSVVVLASKRTDGSYLLALIKASATGNR